MVITMKGPIITLQYFTLSQGAYRLRNARTDIGKIRSLKSKLLMAFGVLLALILLTGCTAGSKDHELKMASVNDMPAEVKAAPVSVRDAYQFAVANQQVLQEIPCYCGCGPIGHTSNYDCYVSSQDSSGEISFDFHSLGCSICVDITQDTMRLLKDGKSTPEIKSYIDSAYARYGPSNMP
jgi:hypothetical protein